MHRPPCFITPRQRAKDETDTIADEKKYNLSIKRECNKVVKALMFTVMMSGIGLKRVESA